MTRWEKMSAVGSILSGLAIISAGIGLILTYYTVQDERQSLLDSEREQSLHLRPWVGFDTGAMRGIVLANGSYIPANQFFDIQNENPQKLSTLGVKSVCYGITFKNYGSTPAENLLFRFSWTNHTKPSPTNLIPISNYTNHDVLFPDETLQNNPTCLPWKTYQEASNNTDKINYVFEITYDYNGGNGFYYQLGHIDPNKLVIDIANVD